MTVFFDVDTQLDFVNPSGALYVPGAEKRIPMIAALNRRAQRLVSTVDAHPENDIEFRTWPPHCIMGTLGQRKPSETLVGGSQIIFEKTALHRNTRRFAFFKKFERIRDQVLKYMFHLRPVRVNGRKLAHLNDRVRIFYTYLKV